MSEYIGSRIALISKSDIKYIGTLHEINSENHTVALENVKSYGTEGRKGPGQEIPPNDNIYDYIVFRGSDVKELTIVAPPGEPKENERPQVPDDPAILGSARPQAANQAPPPPHQQPNQDQFRGPPPQYPPPSQFGYQGPPPPPGQFAPPPPRFQGPGGPHGFPGQPGAVPGYGYGPPPPGYPPGPMGGYGPPPGPGFRPGPPPGGPFSPGPQHQGGPPGPQNAQQQHMPSPSQIGSLQPTPQPTAGQPPSQGPQQTKPVEMSATPNPPSAAEAPAPTTDTAVPTGPKAKAASKVDRRVAVPLPVPGSLSAKPPQAPSAAKHAAAPAASSTQVDSIQDATQAATAAVAAAMARLGTGNQAGPDKVDNLTQKFNQLRTDPSQQQQSYRGRGRGRGGPSSTYRGGASSSAPKAVEVPKEDFDFETSNAKFNKQDLIKEAIASGSPVTSPSNDTTADPIASASSTTITNANGHANGDAANDDVVIPPSKAGYDKKSSFFDDISSDLKDRESHETIDGRMLRREERTRNVETFGQGSVDTGLRGGYRGRGRGNRGFGGPRGGGGYRGGRGGFESRGGGSTDGSSTRGRGRSYANAV